MDTEFEHALVAGGCISSEELDRVRLASQTSGRRLASVLSRLGLVDDEQIADSLAAVSGFPRFMGAVSENHILDPAINPRYLSRHAIAPIAREAGPVLLVMADPGDRDAFRAMQFATEADEIEPRVAGYGEIEALVSRLAPTTIMAHNAVADVLSTLDSERLSDRDADAPIIRLVDRLVTDAVNRRASDIHIEPMTRQVVVRYRIDGQLLEVAQLAHTLAAPIASRIKIMASLDIAETRLPQDGRLTLAVNGRDVDIRVATSPIAHGESLVLRILGRTSVPLNLDQIGLSQHVLHKLLDCLSRPHGMILVTGPTGSGKTTTLYAALNRLRGPTTKILTVEDPVEVILDGVNQVQVRPDIDLDYPAALRAFLRQDPDILMVGEIRDRETADIALRASLTGHLVLSTLHTNTAVGAFARLRDIGIEPYLMASTIVASLAQRLVRGLCSSCRREQGVGAQEAELFLRHLGAVPERIYEPGGCSCCSDSGYKGRHPIVEYFEVDEAARRAIHDGSIERLDEARSGPETLLGHGLTLVSQGLTSLAEVERVVAAR